MIDAESFADFLTAGKTLAAGSVTIDLDGFRLGIRSNSELLLERLAAYFDPFLGSGTSDVEVTAIESEPLDVDGEFRDWKREPGKSGRKDTCRDLTDGRVVRKVRTGMVFLQSERFRVAVGPCIQFQSQVINFINTQYMNQLQRQGAVICHAAAVVIKGSCLALAGFSGGGKSSLVLRLLGESGGRFLSNDRLFLVEGSDGPVDAVGIPKLPRVNPGTIFSLPALRPILGEARCEELRSMPADELWQLEEKHDVDVEAVYGSGRIQLRAPLVALLVLNWDRDSQEPCSVSRVDLGQRSDLLEPVMKSPGPFYQFPDGSFYQDDMEPDPAAYLERLRTVEIFEARGRVDFELACRECRMLMGL